LKYNIYEPFHGKIHLEKIVPKLVPLWKEQVKKEGISRVREHVRAEKMEVLDLFTGVMNPRVKPLPSEWKSPMEISCRNYCCPYCVLGNTKILILVNARRKMDKVDRKLIVGKQIRKLKKGDRVLGYDVSTNSVVINTVISVMKRRDVIYYKLKLGNGYVLSVTGEHPVWTERGWVNVSRLKVGDNILFFENAYLEADKKHSELMRKNNPVTNPMVCVKISRTVKKRWEKGVFDIEHLKHKHPLTVEKIRNTLREGGFKICKVCGSKFYVSPCRLEDAKYCSQECYNISKVGEGNPNWRGGTCRIPYPYEFDEEYKETVRWLYGNRCVICGRPQKNPNLSVHHINYDKTDCRLENLVPLCKECHNKTLRNREYWKKFLTKKVEEILDPCWVSIKSIEKIDDGVHTFYNIETTNTNNYFANGILVHNCFNIDPFESGSCYQCRYCFSILTKSSLYSSWFDGNPWVARFPAKGFIREYLTNVLNARGVEPKERARVKEKPKWSGTVGDINALKKAAAQRIPLRMGNRSEPFFPVEKRHGATKEALEVLNDFDYPLIINTKGDLLLEEPYFSLICNLSKVAIQVSIIHNDDGEARKLEPAAPTSTRRWEVIKAFNDVGVVALPRLEPIMAFINDSDEHLKAYAQKAAECGVKYCLMDSYSYTTRSPEVVKAFKVVGYNFERMFWATSEFQVLGSYIIQKASYYLKKQGIKTSTFDFRTIPYNDTDTCCSIDPVFGNWYHYNTYTATDLIVKKGKLSFVGFDEMFYGEELTPGIRQRVKDVWNFKVPDPWCPKFCEGVYDTGERDEEGNVIWGFDKSRLDEGYKNLIAIFEGD